MKIAANLQNLVLIVCFLTFTFINSQTKQSDSFINTFARENIDFQVIRLEFSASNNLSRELVLGFSDQTTDEYDYGYDAQMNNFFSNDLASLLNDEKMVIQAFSELVEDKQVELVLNSDATCTYSIRITELSNISDAQEIYLYDTLENVNHNLRNGDYNFSAAAGEDSSRFVLNFNGETSLSVKDNSFNTIDIRVDSNNRLYANGLNEKIETLRFINVLGKTIKTYTNLNSQELNNGIALQNVNKGIYIMQAKLESGKTLAKKVVLK